MNDWTLLIEKRPDEESKVIFLYPSGVEIHGIWSKEKKISTWNIESDFHPEIKWKYYVNTF